MNYKTFISLVGKLPVIELQTVAQLKGESRHTLNMQLSRWKRQGKLAPLRRGMYVLGKPYRRIEPNPALLANLLYRPSYLSGLWALGYYGLIPEKVVLFTSVTPRMPGRFENEFGRFSYTHIKPAAFAGYQALAMDDRKVLIALPEKALLDYWHSEKGEWTPERMRAMRFQNLAMVSPKKLAVHAEPFQSPRLQRAARAWRAYVKTENQGVREL